MKSRIETPWGATVQGLGFGLCSGYLSLAAKLGRQFQPSAPSLFALDQTPEAPNQKGLGFWGWNLGVLGVGKEAVVSRRLSPMNGKNQRVRAQPGRQGFRVSAERLRV